MDRVAEIIDLFETKGAEQYGGEAVTQLEHALQSAALAEAESGVPSLIAAALLHDVGHLLAKTGNDDRDDKHEDIGWGYLKSRFQPVVTEPIRLHVPAKRYLCSVDDAYFGILSPASVRTLELQGGRLSRHDAAEFARGQFASDAVSLRRWDDRAKTPGAPTKKLTDYVHLLRSLSC